MKVQCEKCNKEFDKPENQIKKTKHNFCSRSCSASFLGQGKTRNKPKERICKICSNTFLAKKPHRSYMFCPDCYVSNGRKMITEYKKSLTIADYQKLTSVAGKHPCWINTHIRVLNRSWNRNLTNKPCAVCGYSLHVELCHKKAITSYPKTATIGEVNDPSNIVPLCPNHHWEFDNGHLSL